jgi:hypothetical protein
MLKRLAIIFYIIICILLCTITIPITIGECIVFFLIWLITGNCHFEYILCFILFDKLFDKIYMLS